MSEEKAWRGGVNGKRLVRGANGDFFGTVSAKAQLLNSRVGLHKHTLWAWQHVRDKSRDGISFSIREA